MILLPWQFYIVLTQGNLYPCVHLPGFQPVLDSGTDIFYTDKKLIAVASDGERITVPYTALFNTLPEFFARHTMNHLFKGADNTDYIDLDMDTKQWLLGRLHELTGKSRIAMFEVETIGYRYPKQEPQKPTVTSFYTLYLPFNE
jgi:hypothetical protein